MFVIISFLLSAAILATFYYFAQTREHSYHQKHSTVSSLRQIVHLCRQHRAATHSTLVTGKSNTGALDVIAHMLEETVQQLIRESSVTDKPVYRILQSKLSRMTTEWHELSVSRNQIRHGKVIRHCLFLVDEIMITWVIEAQRHDLSDEYHQSWNQIIDTLDSLTQFRVAIQDLESEEGIERIKFLSDTLHRRLHKLAQVSPMAVTSPACQLICEQLQNVVHTEGNKFSHESLYHLSSDISLMVFNIYDYVLADVAENVYVPLPKLATPI